MTPLTLENTAIVVDSTCDPPPGFFDRPGLCHGAAQGALRRRDLPRRGRPDARRVLRQARGVAGAADDLAADRRRVRHASTSGSAASTSTSLAFHLSSRLSGTFQARRPRPNRSRRSRSTTRASSRRPSALLIERLRARLAQGIDARRGARLHRRTSCETAASCSRSPRSSTCAAAGASAERSRWSATSSASGR